MVAIDANDKRTKMIILGILCVIGFVVLCKVFDAISSTQSQEAQSGASMLRQAHEWYNMSVQDSAPIVAMQHINFATAYLNSARHLCRDTLLERSGGLDVQRLSRAIQTHREKVNKALQSRCPKLKMKQMSSDGSAWLDI